MYSCTCALFVVKQPLGVLSGCVRAVAAASATSAGATVFGRRRQCSSGRSHTVGTRWSVWMSDVCWSPSFDDVCCSNWYHHITHTGRGGQLARWIIAVCFRHPDVRVSPIYTSSPRTTTATTTTSTCFQ